MSVVVTAVVHPRPGLLEEALATYARHIDAVHAEPGCELYALHTDGASIVIIEKWADQRGVLVKAIEDAALATASIYRSLGMELPTKMVYARDHIFRKFTELLAQYMPFDLVIDELTADGNEARVSKTSEPHFRPL